MIVHEPIDNIRSTNQLLHYSSPKTSEDAHEFIVTLQQLLLDELENSEKNPGRTCNDEVYDNNLYSSMKDCWDLFTGEITHEYTSTSCKNTSQNHKQIDYLLLKFPDEHHECDLNCTVESLLQYNLREEKLDYTCSFCIKITSAMEKVAITKYPSFMCIYSVALEETIMAPLLQQFSFLPLALT